MYCNTCGKSLLYDSGFCSNCGIRIPQTTAALTPSPHVPLPLARPSSEELRGLGGWLLLFWATITVFQPVLAMKAIFRYPPTVPSIVLAVLTALSVTTGVYIAKGHPRAQHLRPQHLNVHGFLCNLGYEKWSYEI